MGNYESKAFEAVENNQEDSKKMITGCVKLNKKIDSNVPAGFVLLNPQTLRHADILMLMNKPSNMDSLRPLDKIGKSYKIIRDSQIENGSCIANDHGNHDNDEQPYSNYYTPVMYNSLENKVTKVVISVKLRYDSQASQYVHTLNSPDINTETLCREYFGQPKVVTIGCAKGAHQDLIFLDLIVTQMSVEVEGQVYQVFSGMIDPSITQFEWFSESSVLRLSSDPKSNKFISKEEFFQIEKQIAGVTHVLESIWSNLIEPRMLNNLSDYGIKLGLGAVFDGPPGTGKSVLAEYIAKGVKGKYMFVRGPELKSKYVGQTESALRDLVDIPRRAYKKAGNYAPIHIVCIDEMDSVCPKRQMSEASTHNNSMTNQLLSCLSADVPRNLILIGTTNRLDMVDEAMIREGRMGLVYKFELPDLTQRQKIIELYLSRIPKTCHYISTGAKRVKVEHFSSSLAKVTSGLTGADIEATINRVKLNHISHQIQESEQKNTLEISLCDIETALVDKKSVLDKFKFHVWDPKLAEFCQSTVGAYKRSAPGVVLTVCIQGHGVVSLAKYLSRELLVPFISNVEDVLPTKNCVIYCDNHNLNMKRFVYEAKNSLKSASQKALIVIRKFEHEDDEMKVSFNLKPLESLDECQEAIKYAKISQSLFDLKSLEFPLPFSFLFRHLADDK